MPLSAEIDAAHLAVMHVAEKIKFERRAGESYDDTVKRCLAEFLILAIPAALTAAEEERKHRAFVG